MWSVGSPVAAALLSDRGNGQSIRSKYKATLTLFYAIELSYTIQRTEVKPNVKQQQAFHGVFV